jgi:hypothetical protein
MAEKVHPSQKYEYQQPPPAYEQSLHPQGQQQQPAYYVPQQNVPSTQVVTGETRRALLIASYRSIAQ